MDLARVTVLYPLAEGDPEVALAELVAEARTRSEAFSLTGFSSSDGRHLIEVFEGRASDVLIALAMIEEDPRYAGMQVLAKKPAMRRIFAAPMGHRDARTFRSTPVDLAALSPAESLLLLRHIARDVQQALEAAA